MEKTIEWKSWNKLVNRRMMVSDTVIWSHKVENLPWIESRRWDAVETNSRIFEHHWRPFFDALRPLKKIWGKNGERTVVIVYSTSIEGGSIHLDYPRGTERDQVLLAPDDELPLFINNLKEEDAKQLLEKRMNGEEPPCVPRQDLIDEYFSTENRLQRTYKVIAIYNDLMDRYIRDKYAHIMKESRFSSIPVTFRINGRRYLFMFENYSIKRIGVPEGSSYDIEL